MLCVLTAWYLMQSDFFRATSKRRSLRCSSVVLPLNMGPMISEMLPPWVAILEISEMLRPCFAAPFRRRGWQRSSKSNVAASRGFEFGRGADLDLRPAAIYFVVDHDFAEDLAPLSFSLLAES